MFRQDAHGSLAHRRSRWKRVEELDTLSETQPECAADSRLLGIIQYFPTGVGPIDNAAGNGVFIREGDVRPVLRFELVVFEVEVDGNLLKAE